MKALLPLLEKCFITHGVHLIAVPVDYSDNDRILNREIAAAFEKIHEDPEYGHFDSSGLRRLNLKRFPYHVLYLVKPDRIGIQMVRHNSRYPFDGSKRKRD